MTITRFVADLKREAKSRGGQKQLAEAIGCSPQYLCDVLNGRRDPGATILKHYGVKIVKEVVQKAID